MFTGIIENIATVVSVKRERSNLTICFKSAITNELKIDQSLSHNGVCLTVVNIFKDTYTVTAIKETLKKSNLTELEIGDKVNLERSMKLGGRLDGHIVQGHVDQIAECINIIEENGSWIFTFHYKSSENITVEKGSVCVNGVSLTVIKSRENSFSVAIIPYTYHNTTFHTFNIGTTANIEFDIVGKYINKIAFMDF
tara:strand:+ start:4895 stop:5482 length:588 start_codon:yes stop_codon:yes gene_type:complete